MIPIDGQPILSAAQMRAVEEAAAPTPDAMYALMERAGAGVADAVRRLAAGAEVLVLCGPGNNGGDGYVAARVLREQGCPVRVSALSPPRTDLSRAAAASWGEPVKFYTRGDDPRLEHNPWADGEPAPAPVLVDALFGTGARASPHDEPWADHHREFFEFARLKIAADLPLGLSADGMRVPADDTTHADVTLALGALKPAHILPSALHTCGEVRVIDLGLDLRKVSARVVSAPPLRRPAGNFNKFDRGVVGVIAGKMPGAAHLAATAAARAGAGYVILFGGAPGGPEAIVRRPLDEEALGDERINSFVIGSGLGRDDEAREILERVLRVRGSRRLVLDADALRLLDLGGKDRRLSNVILTPHHGEYRHMTDQIPSGQEETTDPDEPFNAQMAFARAVTDGIAVLVLKGSTTIIADCGAARVSPRGNPWLSTAGTGDVLAGAIGATAADPSFNGKPLIEAAAAGVWLHAEAARRCGAAFIADDLADALTAARASL